MTRCLQCLHQNYGKISCAAKGARRSKSALLAGSQFLCFGEYLLYQGSTTYHINSCETIEMFYNLRQDLDKLKYATHITKIIYDVTNENENCYNIMQLFLNTLYIISETDKDMDLILAIFKLRLMCILGFSPSIRTDVRIVKQRMIYCISVLKIVGLNVEHVENKIKA